MPTFSENVYKTRTTLMLFIALSLANGTVVDFHNASFKWFIESPIDPVGLCFFLVFTMLYYMASLDILVTGEIADQSNPRDIRSTDEMFHVRDDEFLEWKQRQVGIMKVHFTLVPMIFGFAAYLYTLWQILFRY